MLRRGHLAPLESLADYALYFAEFAFLARVDNGYGYACLSGAACSAGAVGVDGGVVGQTVVYHMGEVVDVEPAGCHIGGDEEGDDAVAEFFSSQCRAAAG